MILLLTLNMQLLTGLVFQSKNINDIENQLNEHCLKSVRICSFSGPYFPVFSPNAGKYGPEKLRIRILHAV